MSAEFSISLSFLETLAHLSLTSVRNCTIRPARYLLSRDKCKWAHPYCLLNGIQWPQHCLCLSSTVERQVTSICLQMPQNGKDDCFVEASETPVDPKLERRKLINFLCHTMRTLSIFSGDLGRHVHVFIAC